MQKEQKTGRPEYQNDPELVRQAARQLGNLNVTAISGDQGSGFASLRISYISAIHEEYTEIGASS